MLTRKPPRTGTPERPYELISKTAPERLYPDGTGVAAEKREFSLRDRRRRKCLSYNALWRRGATGTAARHPVDAARIRLRLPRWTILRDAAISLMGALLLAVGSGCRTEAPTKINYEAQENLLTRAIVRLDESPETGDAEVRSLLKQLEGELAESRRRHTAAQKRIAELEDEVVKLRQAAGFAVHHIEILYFTHLTEKEIDLWVSPFDRHNDVVKTAGSFEISLHRPAAFKFRRRGRKLAEWRFSAQEVETLWEGELFEGYHLKLAWPGGKPPEVESLVLHVEFTVAGGKTYSADKELMMGSESP